MMKNRTLQLTAAAAIVALAGTAQAAKYIPVTAAGVDATNGYTAAQKLMLAQDSAAQAGWYEATISSSVIYGDAGVSMDNIRVTVPILLWENDALLNTPVVQVLGDGTVFGATSTFFNANATDTFNNNFSGRKGMVMAFSNVTGANANNVFVDESFDGDEVDNANMSIGENPARSNTVGVVTPRGIVMWKARFGSGQNNIEYIDGVGTRPGATDVQIGGSIIPPAQTTLGLPGEVPSAGSGAKVFSRANGVDGASGGLNTSLPSAVTTTSGLILNYIGTGWDRDFSGANSSPNPSGHHVFTRATYSATAQPSITPQWSWPSADPTDDGNGDGRQIVPVAPGSSLGSMRRHHGKLVKVNNLDSAMHIVFGVAFSGRGNTTVGSTNACEILVVDRLDARSTVAGSGTDGFGNGYANGAFFLPANPNYDAQFFTPDFTNNIVGSGTYVDPYAGLFTPNGSTNGVDGDYGWVSSRDDAAQPGLFDINQDGDLAAVWLDISNYNNGIVDDNPMGETVDRAIYEVRLYEATVVGNSITDYAAPVVIARSGDGTTYGADNFTFQQFNSPGCGDDGRFIGRTVNFSGVSIDNDGNVAFTAVADIVNRIEDDSNDPMGEFTDPNGFDVDFACWGDVTPGNGDFVELPEESTNSLFFYVADEDTLLRTVDSGINGLEIAASAGAPKDYAVALGRFRNGSDTDKFGAASMSDSGRVAAVAFRGGDFDGDADNDGVFNDPRGFFLRGDDTIENKGGLLIDRNAAGDFSGQVIAAVRGVAVVEFGEITTAPAGTLCTADLDGNFMVDLDDFSIFIAQFGNTAGDCAMGCTADLDGVNGVDLDDFSIFIAQFGNTAADCDPNFGG